MKRCRTTKLVALGFAYLLLTTTLAAYTNAITQRRKRRWGVRPLNRQRKRLGHFETLVKFIKHSDTEQFFKYTRLSPEVFNTLLDTVGVHLQKHPPNSNAISPEERLVMTLHLLSQGTSQQDLAWNYYMGKATVHHIIKETCEVLWNVLSPIYLKTPSHEDFVKISEGFFNQWNMPNCIGALDGKHVAIQCPKNSGSQFFNYKKTFSIVFMATCDAQYNFSMVDIGAAGANHDGAVFQDSIFGHALLQEQLPLPPTKPLPRTNITLPHFLVADQAFPLNKHIMRPYPGINLSEGKQIFNYRLSRARRTIENSFGILAQRWRILRRTIIGDITTCESIVKATVVLHNFVQAQEHMLPEKQRLYVPTGYADYIDDEGNLHLGQWRTEEQLLRNIRRVGANNAGQRARENRDLLAQYFESEAGAVPWQYDHIHAGGLPDM